MPTLVGLQTIPDKRGEIIVVESAREIPFVVRRAFLIHRNVWPAKRGGHAHKAQWQMLIAVAGRIVVQATDPFGKVAQFELRERNVGLLVPPMCWLDVDISFKSTLLALASGAYDEAEYIRDAGEFFE